MRAAWPIPKMADCDRQNRKRKQRQSTSEGIIKKSKEMMPSGDLPWQTTEPVKPENKGTSK